jgi:phage shock protein C
MNSRRLFRSADDRILAGVAGGVANYFDVDPVIVRIIWFLSVFISGSLTFWAYVVMAIVVPVEPANWPAPSPWAPGGAPIATGPNFVPPTPGAAPAAEPGAPTASGDAGTAPTADPQAANPGMPQAPAAGGWTGGWAGGWGGGDWRSQRRAERWQRRAERRSHERSSPGLVFGLLLILVGGLLAWHQIDPTFDLNITWPIVVIAFGAILVVSSLHVGGKDN